MRILILTSLLLLCFRAGLANAEEQYFSVRVAEPYIELHTGPGRGYPVFHVADRGEQLVVLVRRTDWFKVRTAGGKEGWATREAMELTLTPEGDATRFADAELGDISRRRWEAGLLGGDFEGADVITVYAGYAITPNFSAELSLSQAFGNYSDAIIAGINLLAQPFPEWRVSPFFSLGSGIIYTDPNVTLVDENDRTEPIGNVGIGVRCYLTRRFMLRAEYRNYVIFQNKDDNQEIDGWEAGFAFFF
ncbi:MAG TPA: outer membrane beta-barrel protein [Gammaproteobacteria bacterium]|nr:outer membrane beta-barrel protein [Gammaproteobacteria bacterium]